MTAIKTLLFILGGIWLLSFIVNLIHFLKAKAKPLDRIFFNKNKDFKEAYTDLKLLEDAIGTSLEVERKKIAFYEKNARLTKRKYFYYTPKIEPLIMDAFLGLDRSKKKCWKLLDTSVQVHFAYILSLFFMLIALIAVASFRNGFDIGVLIGLIVLVVVILIFLRTIIKLNYVIFFILIDAILLIFNQDRNRLYRNLAIIEFMTKEWWGRSSGGMIIGAGGASGFGGSGGGGFGGFGGGSFGGGGAGGSW